MIIPILHLRLWNTLLFIKLVQIVKTKFNETTLKKLLRATRGFTASLYIYITKTFDFLLTSPELATLLSFL